MWQVHAYTWEAEAEPRAPGQPGLDSQTLLQRRTKRSPEITQGRSQAYGSARASHGVEKLILWLGRWLAQLVKVWRHKDWSEIPTTHKEQSLSSQRSEGEDRDISGAGDLKTNDSQAKQETLSQKARWPGPEEANFRITSGLHLHTHTRVSSCICTHMNTPTHTHTWIHSPTPHTPSCWRLHIKQS